MAAALAQGKMLYRDVWYPYSPGAPYLNAFLFRLFGIHTTVAYLAGGLAALAVALTLFRCGLYLISLPVALAVAYVTLIQSFGPGIFNYPLPYSYAAVYGSVAACLFLLYAIRAAFHSTNANMFWAGIWSAAALLMKLEYGLACFGTLAVLQIGLFARQRSWRVASENLSSTIPALLICAVVIGWMVAIRGVAFITDENFTSWPTSYFMHAYGQLWLGGQGLDWSLSRLLSALLVTTTFVAFWTGFRFCLLSAFRQLSFRNVGAAVIVAAGALALWTTRPERLNDDIGMLVFPPTMVFIVSLTVPVAAVLYWWHRWESRQLAILVTLTFGFLLGVRILFGMLPYAYAIFYNGPALLGFCWVLFSIAIPATGGRNDPRRQKAILLVCAATCVWVTVQVYPAYREMRQGRVALHTDRGTIYVPEDMLPAWRKALDFIRHAKITGARVLSVPEDTALYFFSSVLCPIRVCIFTPGVIAPGRMTDEVIGELERAQVRYVIWSNRTFYEYGVTEFGVDSDRPLGDYIRANYRPVQQFGSAERPDGWHATLWQKK